jgi:hypothetical protein
MLPLVASISLSTRRAVVVLPHPDSPTSPSVSPCLIVKETSSTACTSATLRWRIPLVIGKRLVRCSTSRRMSDPAEGGRLEGSGTVD